MLDANCAHLPAADTAGTVNHARHPYGIEVLMRDCIPPCVEFLKQVMPTVIHRVKGFHSISVKPRRERILGTPRLLNSTMPCYSLSAVSIPVRPASCSD